MARSAGDDDQSSKPLPARRRRMSEPCLWSPEPIAPVTPRDITSAEGCRSRKPSKTSIASSERSVQRVFARSRTIAVGETLERARAKDGDDEESIWVPGVTKGALRRQASIRRQGSTVSGFNEADQQTDAEKEERSWKQGLYAQVRSVSTVLHRRSTASSSTALGVEGMIEFIGNQQSMEAQMANVLSTPMGRLVVSDKFNIAFTVLIVLNVIYIGFETDYNKGTTKSVAWFSVDIIFTLLFTVELVFRILGLQICFILDGWNLFDFLLVLIAILDNVILGLSRRLSDEHEDGGLSIFAAMRVARLFRAARIFRLLRFFKELWLLVSGVLDSMRTLLWTWGLVLLLTYVFAVSVTRVLGQGYGHVDSRMSEYFGTVTASMFTLFQVVTMEGWADIARASMEHEPWMWVFFVLFISLTTFGIMNVLTAVIVESTVFQAGLDKKDVTKMLEKERVRALTRIHDTFQASDLDGNGSLTKDEFMIALHDPVVLKNLHAVEIDLLHAEELFDIMDYDGSGSLDVQEFIEGCMRSRGNARAKDMLALQCDMWRTQEWLKDALTEVDNTMTDQFNKLKQEVSAVKHIVLTERRPSRTPPKLFTTLS